MNRLLVDALNVAYWCGEPPQLRLPLSLAAGLQARGQAAVLYFDANARHCLAADAETYLQLLQHPRLCAEAPSGKRADGLMLKQARDSGASIVSRDRFRDHRKRYRRLIDDPGRVFSGFVKDERLFIEGLQLDLPLWPSSPEASAALGLQWRPLASAISTKAG